MQNKSLFRYWDVEEIDGEMWGVGQVMNGLWEKSGV